MSRKLDHHADDYAETDEKKKVMSRKSEDHAKGHKRTKLKSGKSNHHADDHAERDEKKKFMSRKSDGHADNHAEGDKKKKAKSGKTDNHAEEHKRKKLKSGKKGVVAGKPTVDALKLVLKTAQACKGLSRGLHECQKMIERHGAKLCLLAADCNKTNDVDHIKALCIDHNVGLISVPSSKTLAEWAGLCKFDAEGNATDVLRCSCLVVKDFGEVTEALHIVQEFLGGSKLDEFPVVPSIGVIEPS